MTGRKSELEPLEVFRAICETGSVRAAARRLHYAEGSLRSIASYDVKHGRYAAQFALDAGMYVAQANRARRLAGLPEFVA